MLEVRNLRKEFQPLSGPPVTALGDVSFRVEAGQFVSVVGPSGCGKSTLLQCLAGLLRPTAGHVLFDGREVTGPPEGLILLFQEYNRSLMAWRTVLGNVRFALEGRGGRISTNFRAVSDQKRDRTTTLSTTGSAIFLGIVDALGDRPDGTVAHEVVALKQLHG